MIFIALVLDVHSKKRVWRGEKPESSLVVCPLVRYLRVYFYLHVTDRSLGIAVHLTWRPIPTKELQTEHKLIRMNEWNPHELADLKHRCSKFFAADQIHSTDSHSEPRSFVLLRSSSNVKLVKNFRKSSLRWWRISSEDLSFWYKAQNIELKNFFGRHHPEETSFKIEHLFIWT